jgi:type II secretory pathway pseudopilin PulG
MKNKSFTLIEILIVIIIIGLLAGLIITSTASSIESTNTAKAHTFSTNARKQLMFNIVQEWKFDEGSGGTIYDVNKSSNSASLSSFSTTAGSGDNGSCGWLSPKYCVSGTCLNFDGVTVASVNTPDVGGLPLFTLAAWVYNRSGGNSSRSILRNFWEINGENVRFYSYYFGPTTGDDGTNHDYWRYSTGSKIKYEKWSYVVTVWDGTYVSHYINGEFNWKDTNASYGTSQGFVQIAGYSGRLFKGRLDEMIIHDKNLSVSEIRQNYIAGLDSLLAQGGISKEEYNERIKQLAENKYK